MLVPKVKKGHRGGVELWRSLMMLFEHKQRGRDCGREQNKGKAKQRGGEAHLVVRLDIQLNLLARKGSDLDLHCGMWMIVQHLNLYKISVIILVELGNGVCTMEVYLGVGAMTAYTDEGVLGAV